MLLFEEELDTIEAASELAEISSSSSVWSSFSEDCTTVSNSVSAGTEDNVVSFAAESGERSDSSVLLLITGIDSVGAGISSMSESFLTVPECSIFVISILPVDSVFSGPSALEAGVTSVISIESSPEGPEDCSDEATKSTITGSSRLASATLLEV